MRSLFILFFLVVFTFVIISCSADSHPRLKEDKGVGTITNKNETDTMLPPASQFKGFVLEQLRIPLEEIKDGGPPKDGIPSIDFPKFIVADEDTFLKSTDLVLGVTLNGIMTAYPVRILNYHEVVNDKFGNQPVVITYCPLCGSGVAFLAGEPGKERIFGVSGLLYNSDVLLYDRTTESLWSQIMAKAISGPLSGTRLEAIPTEQTTWADWKSRYPQTMVLTTNTGHDRDYNRSPYAGYDRDPDIYFPVIYEDDQFSNKEKVIGIEVNGKYKAYPFSRLAKQQKTIKDEFNGQSFLISYDPDAQSARVTTIDGQPYPGLTLYWFAWYAFHPQTQVYKKR